MPLWGYHLGLQCSGADLRSPAERVQAYHDLLHIRPIEQVAGVKVLSVGHSKQPCTVDESLDVLTLREGHRRLRDLLTDRPGSDRVEQVAKQHCTNNWSDD